VWRERWQPTLFVFHQGCRHLASRQSYEKFIAEAEQLVVPSFASFDQRQRRQIFVLLLQERPHERRVDRDFRGGHPLKRHEPVRTVSLLWWPTDHLPSITYNLAVAVRAAAGRQCGEDYETCAPSRGAEPDCCELFH
jgi:hypothetical protein